MITKFAPLPANGGGKQRSLALLTRLAEHFTVTLCAFDDGGADLDGLRAMGVDVHTVPFEPRVASTARALPAIGSVTAARFWNRELAGAVRTAAGNDLDLLQIEYAQLAPYGRGVKARMTVLDLHNVESALMDRYARSHRGARRLAGSLEARALRRLERSRIHSADVVSGVSTADRDRLPVPAREVLVCPNGWEPAAALPASPEPNVVFVGQLAWAPNVDAARWIVDEIWPLVIERRPDAHLYLVGGDPPATVRALAGATITVTGRVPDVRPYLQRAQVALAPLRAGGGTRLKVLEALDAGRPLVATTIGVEGLEDLVGTGVVTADQPRELAGAIVSLLDDPPRAIELGRAGNAAVAAKYAWDRTLAPLIDRVRR